MLDASGLWVADLARSPLRGFSAPLHAPLPLKRFLECSLPLTRFSARSAHMLRKWVVIMLSVLSAKLMIYILLNGWCITGPRCIPDELSMKTTLLYWLVSSPLEQLLNTNVLHCDYKWVVIMMLILSANLIIYNFYSMVGV